MKPISLRACGAAEAATANRTPLRAFAAQPEIAFYRHFEALLARARRFVRPPCQTQLEFARVAGSQLAAEADFACRRDSRLRRVVESFYRVRFGHAR